MAEYEPSFACNWFSLSYEQQLYCNRFNMAVPLIECTKEKHNVI
jgi:hypothetical protein